MRVRVFGSVLLALSLGLARGAAAQLLGIDLDAPARFGIPALVVEEAICFDQATATPMPDGFVRYTVTQGRVTGGGETWHLAGTSWDRDGNGRFGFIGPQRASTTGTGAVLRQGTTLIFVGPPNFGGSTSFADWFNPPGPIPNSQFYSASELPFCADEDTDGDGLLDRWEVEGGGIDTNGDNVIDLDLFALGADPLHKDLFIEIDYMVADDHSHEPA